MNLFDIILLIILLIFIWKGFQAGLIGAIGGFIGIIVGIVLGGRFMSLVSAWLAQFINIDNANLANIIAFVLIFILVNIIIGLLVKLINAVFHIIPFIDLVNKLLGAVVGLIGGMLVASAVVYLLSLFPISDTVNDAVAKSSLAPIAKNISVVVVPLMPEAIKNIKSILN
ncbi:MAG: CvpA family protein [Patescibacteria group bacterium]